MRPSHQHIIRAHYDLQSPLVCFFRNLHHDGKLADPNMQMLHHIIQFFQTVVIMRSNRNPQLICQICRHLHLLRCDARRIHPFSQNLLFFFFGLIRTHDMILEEFQILILSLSRCMIHKGKKLHIVVFDILQQLVKALRVRHIIPTVKTMPNDMISAVMLTNQLYQFIIVLRRTKQCLQIL